MLFYNLFDPNTLSLLLLSITELSRYEKLAGLFSSPPSNVTLKVVACSLPGMISLTVWQSEERIA